MKVAIITCHRTYNYGAVLQAYALQTFLNNRGHYAEIIDYYPQYVRTQDRNLINFPKLILKIPDKVKCNASFGKFLKDRLNLTDKTYKTCSDLSNDHLNYDLYITGSDQVWNMNMNNGLDDSYFLSFAPSNSIKISYAASIAMDEINDEQKKRFIKMLAPFSSISVRENTGVQLLKNIGIKSYAVCDPVYLINKNEWEFIEKNPATNDKYVLVYAFYQQKEIYEKAWEIAKKYGYKVYSVGASYFNSFMKVDKYFWGVSPELFIGLIHNAQMVLTNSFHGLSFSIILNIPVIAYKTNTKGNSRIIDMLKQIGVYVENNSNYIAEITDYSEVNEKVTDYRVKSMEYISRCNL